MTTMPEPQKVEHVDHVEHLENAALVGRADHIGTVQTLEVHGEPIRTVQVRRLAYIRDIAGLLTVVLALIALIVVMIDKNHNEGILRAELSSIAAERKASDARTASKLECTRRYQDRIDIGTENQLVSIGELVVVITKIPPGPEREAAVSGKIEQLDSVNQLTRQAINDKVTYNNAGNPLPCPLVPTPPIQPSTTTP